MAWVNRRKSGSEQCDKRRLRPLKLERHFLFAVDDHIIEVAVPGLPRVEAELVLRLALQQLKRALDVLGRERFAVMPFDALAQFKRQVFAVLAPRPAFAKVGNDRLQASLRHVLLIHDKIVEDAHHWPLACNRRLLMDRHAGWAVEKIQLEDATRLLRECRRETQCDREQQPKRCRKSDSYRHHSPPCSWPPGLPRLGACTRIMAPQRACLSISGGDRRGQDCRKPSRPVASCGKRRYGPEATHETALAAKPTGQQGAAV